MAEEVKELSSGTLTQANLASDGTLPVFTNNGSTTRVVRDVHVGTSTLTSEQARFSVDGIPVSNTLESSSGTVVVPPSNSFDIELNPALVQPTKKSLNFYQINRVSNSQVDLYPITGIEQEGNSDTRFTYDFSGANLGTTASIGSAFDIVPPFGSNGPGNGQPMTQFIKVPAETSYYYWYKDGNSTAYFNRLNYGNDETATGTITTLFNNSYHGPAFDFKRMKYYGSNAGAIREFDLTKSGGLTSNDYTVHGNWFSSNSSYFSADAVNNVYVGSQSSVTYFRNLLLNGGRGQINNNSSDGNNRRTILMYNSSEDRYYLIVTQSQFSSGTTYIGYFEASEIATNTAVGFTISKTDILAGDLRNYMNSRTGGNNYDSYAMFLSRLDDNILAIPYSATSWRLWKGEGGNLVYMGIEISGTQSLNTTYANYLVPYGEINQTNTNLSYTAYSGISTKLRTQGVEIT
tara:strand:- start:81 stop:1463 length:1383 start_codon:yes stop_codon:yes gene_type:complete